MTRQAPDDFPRPLPTPSSLSELRDSLPLVQAWASRIILGQCVLLLLLSIWMLIQAIRTLTMPIEVHGLTAGGLIFEPRTLQGQMAQRVAAQAESAGSKAPR